ncbi:hypothetical protein LTR10_015192 [Elasticomyces elasticus]|uniref:Uncharacterized protein n=1 Tax=Exophiala sideris TaxID=1016849 RepID=A0ABR0JE25_9EURO|nr:hypothetical protein LTR10_015192 [Elasticomyces elasticus]KAK5032666.1 hypothetical protein LTS07_004076 [Exophiala sideris]KAK5037153.1 hypothetical protein LTR13_004958 [Exophiala sideris]KAK5062191.1 hypothetical protein LTR69_004549 [Exophiala sideris]KAK5182311.1 hypothetical protein LTR44_005322 [Eurotiomycetes sp. CCFEE 6388]
MAQWDRSVEEILGQKHVKISSSITRAQIRNDLAKTRRSARAHWHVERLMTPLDRQMEQYVANIARVEYEFVQLRADVQAGREARREALRLFHRSVFLQANDALDSLRRTKEVGDKLRSTAQPLQSVREDFSNESLMPLMGDLKRAGLWAKPPGSFRDQDVSPRGATPKSRNVRRALAGVLFVRDYLNDNAHNITIDLHLLRRLRRARALCLQPDVSHFRFREDRLYHTMYLLGSNMESIIISWQRLRAWVKTSSNDRLNPFYTHDQFHDLFSRMWRTVSVMRDEHHDHLSNITALGIKSDSALQQAQLLECQPLMVWPTMLHNLFENLQEVIDGRHKHDHTKRNLEGWLKKSKDFRRELWDAVDVAITWRGSANLCFGIVNRPRQQSSLTMTTTMTPVLPRPPLDILPEKHTRLPWQVSEDLYPEEGGTPVHFCTQTNYGSLLVLQRFSGCKVVGLDLVVKPKSGILLGSWTAPFDYLVLASDRGVAIFDLGAMRKTSLLGDTLQSILSNPAILKVGVNMEHQRKLLEEYCGNDLTGYYDMTPKTNDSSDEHDPNGSIPTTISSVVARKFGTLLPEIDLSLAGLNLRSQKHPLFSNPPQFFTSLASRGYAALQLYHSACLATGGTDLPGIVAPKASLAAFGPVFLHILNEGLPSDEIKRADRGLQSRALQSISLAMVQHVFREHNEKLWPSQTMLRNMQAYYLFTSFSEDLRTIRSCLQVGNPAAVIHTLAEQYNLPLRAEDRERLKAARGFVSNSDNGLQALQPRSGIQRLKARARRTKSSKPMKTGVQASSSRRGTQKVKARARPARSTKVVAKRDIAVRTVSHTSVRRLTHTFIRKVDPHLIKRFDPYAGANGPDRNGTLEGRSRSPKVLTPSKKSLASENASVGHRAVLSMRHARVRRVASTATAKTEAKGEKKTQHEGSAVAVKPTAEKANSANSKPAAAVAAAGQNGPGSSSSTGNAKQVEAAIKTLESRMAQIGRMARRSRRRLARREKAAARVDQAARSGASSEVR